jgi:hypothetical protein
MKKLALALALLLAGLSGPAIWGSPLPLVTDDAGTPFAVVVIPLDDRLAIKARQR